MENTQLALLALQTDNLALRKKVEELQSEASDAGSGKKLDDNSVTSFLESNPEIKEVYITRPLYWHWFAIELVCAYESVCKQIKEKKTVLSVTINELDYNIELADITRASDHIKAAASLITKETTTHEFGIRSSLDLCTLELSFTTILAAELQTLCFGKNDLPGLIVHQGPVRKLRNADGSRKKGVSEAADVMGFEMDPLGPGAVFFLGEGKKQKLLDSLMELASYANLCSRPNDGTTKNVGLLGLGFTTQMAHLGMYFKDSGSDYNRMNMISIIPDAKPFSPELLAVICAGNRYLCNNQLYMEKCLEQPLPWIQDTIKALTNKTECRTFVEDDLVMKVFDSEEGFLRPNLTLLKEYGHIMSAKLVPFKVQQLQLLQYKFLPGSHVPTCLNDFKPICAILDAMHAKNYVHGDIRIENMVFSPTASNLIDFDLARCKGDPYPERYQGEFPERHITARKRKSMLPKHDRYSLKFIIEREFKVTLDLSVKQLCSAFDLIKQ